MITEEEVNDFIKEQSKNPLLRRAMGLDLPPDDDPFWKEFKKLNEDRFLKVETMVNEYINNFNEYMEQMK